MARVKVYGWRGFRRGAPGHRQTREIMATTSKANVRAALSLAVPASEIIETGNEEEITTAMARPGVVFWRPLDGRGAWNAVEPAVHPARDHV